MAKKSKKKKKLQKRHHFIEANNVSESSIAHQPSASNSKSAARHTQPQSEATSAAARAPELANSVEQPTGHADKDAELTHKTQLMLHDARKTALIGGAIIIILFILWFAFEHTGLGTAIYQLIRV